MSSNATIKRKMIEIYGNKCFIEVLGFRSEKEIRRELRFCGSNEERLKAQELTYHHIIEKSENGETSVQNGALLSYINHQWFHNQSLGYQEYMNSEFQKYKRKKLLERNSTSADSIGTKNHHINLDELKEKEKKIIPIKDNDSDYLEYKRKRNKRVFKKFEDNER